MHSEYTWLIVMLRKGKQTIVYIKIKGQAIVALLLFPGINDILVENTIENLKKWGIDLRFYDYKWHKDYYVDCGENQKECLRLAQLLFLDLPNTYSEKKRSDPELEIMSYKGKRGIMETLLDLILTKKK